MPPGRQNPANLASFHQRATMPVRRPGNRPGRRHYLARAGAGMSRRLASGRKMGTASASRRRANRP